MFQDANMTLISGKKGSFFQMFQYLQTYLFVCNLTTLLQLH